MKNWSCFNINFNVNFKNVLKTFQLCISWWIKKNFDSIKMHGVYVKKNVLPNYQALAVRILTKDINR
jgi:hypothetical protein